MPDLKIIECPRDAMQGIESWIETQTKIDYLNALLKVGFDTLDFGSFVSPKAIPQMKDTAEVYKGLNWKNSKTKLLAIVANERGARDAAQYEGIHYLGFPLSLSETFQQRNTNKGIQEAFKVVGQIQNICQEAGKEQVVYLSMGFGNPYGEPWNSKIVIDFTKRLEDIGIGIVSLSDTIGAASKELITSLFLDIIPAFPNLEIGAHLHSVPDLVNEKVNAVLETGCFRLDGAMRGFGGCPMAEDDLVGNLDTRAIVSVASSKRLLNTIFDFDAFKEAEEISGPIFLT